MEGWGRPGGLGAAWRAGGRLVVAWGAGGGVEAVIVKLLRKTGLDRQ